MYKSFKSGAIAIALLFIAGSEINANAYIAVGIKPVELLVKQLAQGVDEVKLVIPAGKSPHTYHLTPHDAALIAQSDLLIYVSKYVENEIGKLKQSKTYIHVPTIELIGLESLKKHLKENDYDYDHHDCDHGIGHSHEGKYNPHIWLSPKLMLIGSEYIAKELTKLYPAKKDVIAVNLKKTQTSIEKAQEEAKLIIKPLKDKSYFTYHDAYTYFESEYDLDNEGVLNPNVFNKVTPKHLAFLQSKMKEKQVHCIFIEPQFDTSLVSKYLKDISLKFSTLDPLGSDIAADATYADFILKTAQSYQSCLK